MTDQHGELRRIQDVDLAGKTVCVRVDYNVPLNDGVIGDDGRIRASLPTLQTILDKGGKIVLMTHLGRPKGKVVDALRLDPVAERLAELLSVSVHKLDDCIGTDVVDAVASGGPGDVYLLENLRFHSEETKNDPGFSAQLAGLGDVFVNDAFGTVHRSHASTLGVAQHLPAYAGLLMQREIEELGKLLEAPRRPYVAIIGGKKAESKLGALRDLLDHVDEVLIGGGVAFSFLRATGADVGASIVDEAMLDEIREIIAIAEKKGRTIALPDDVVAAQEITATAETRVIDAQRVPAGWMGLDIGPRTVERFSARLRQAGTILWAGPMGAFEVEPFADGTRRVAASMAGSDAFSVVGGGESGEAVKQFGFGDQVSYISTGGGACLALLRGKPMPALEALRA